MTDDTEMTQEQKDAALIAEYRERSNRFGNPAITVKIQDWQENQARLDAIAHDVAFAALREIDRLREAAQFGVTAIDLTEDLIELASGRVTLRNARYGLEVALDPDYEANLAASVRAIQREPISPERLAEWKKHIGVTASDDTGDES
jgi:hypothetical protein